MRVRIYTIIAALAALSITPASAIATPGKAKLRFTAATFAVAENGGTAHLTVTRSARNGKAHSSTNSTVSAAYSTSNGTAIAGTDYTAVRGRVSFPACAGGNPAATDPCLRQTIDIPVADDAVIDGNKSLKVSLNSPSRNAVVVNPQKGTLTIADNEGPNTISFDQPDYKVWELGPQVEIHVIRSGAGISGSSSVDFSTADDSATAPSDYTSQSRTLTFAAGEVEKTVLVDVADDTVVEPTEAFNVNLSGATAGTAVATASEAVTILDDDTPSVAHLTIDATPNPVGEGSDTTVTVSRTGGIDSPASVDYSTLAQTAAANVDFSAIADTLSFDPGDSSQSFTVPTLSDSLQEADETFDVTLGNALPAGTVLDASSTTITIGDDDPLPTVAAGGSTTSGSTVIFDVQLSNPTTHDVTVVYVITD
ncbi:MAG TPA: Calx-beta domain-containing protein, partial [Ilumatobacteraceae bacterium]|nr:Calx-beta domain-containing protein [Ilumatobacteraceae bacterium]